MDDCLPAFPKSEAAYSEDMSLRDYFAAAALQGFVSNRPYLRDLALKDEGTKLVLEALPAFLADQAYILADAMLAERAK